MAKIVLASGSPRRQELLQNIVTEHKELSQQAKNDMMLALITLKYTQSNSVCYVKNGQTIGGRSSRSKRSWTGCISG